MLPNKINDYENFKLYLFTTELLKDYMNDLNIKDKNVLTVAASGDQALNSIFLGAKTVDMFDFNRKAFYYSSLKIAAAKALTYEEFCDYLIKPGTSLIKKIEYYLKIRSLLSVEVKLFFDEAYLLKRKGYTRNKTDVQCATYNLYTNPKNYYELQVKLLNTTINFYQTNLLTLPKKLNRKNYYGTILLSNIFDYLDLSPLETSIFLDKGITPMLENSGTLQYNYDFRSRTLEKEDDIYALLNPDKVQYKELKNPYGNKKDIVKIYTK